MSNVKLKCTKFDLGCGSAPDPAWVLQLSPDPLAGFKGPTSKEGEGKGGKWRGRVGRGRKSGEERGRVGREGEGIGGKERGSAQPCPLHIISGYATERSVK